MNIIFINPVMMLRTTQYYFLFVCVGVKVFITSIYTFKIYQYIYNPILIFPYLEILQEPPQKGGAPRFSGLLGGTADPRVRHGASASVWEGRKFNSKSWHMSVRKVVSRWSSRPLSQPQPPFACLTPHCHPRGSFQQFQVEADLSFPFPHCLPPL